MTRDALSSTPHRAALIAGATGLVGAQCLRQLAGTPAYTRVVALVRRPLGPAPSSVEARLVDFDRLDAITDLHADDAFCTLGTTIAAAGSQEAFRLVDFGYAIGFARLARRAGAARFAVVSSVGASAASPGFYLRTKGEVEDALQGLGFETLVVVRPGLLLGERADRRPAEAIARFAAPAVNLALRGPFRRYRAVDAADVASALVGATLRCGPGVHVLEYDDILIMSGRAPGTPVAW
jgi:uncharacterized protein YbjT (DUF2867 family)